MAGLKKGKLLASGNIPPVPWQENGQCDNADDEVDNPTYRQTIAEKKHGQSERKDEIDGIYEIAKHFFSFLAYFLGYDPYYIK
ncbi:TPA: hypothetical protein DIU27_01900 [Candidatus Collierbacteria bacterium]|uniref:Uncharacterized protein n=1 Tax=Candidatus Collierbacteria bacterium GW2011_GWB2_44_22 TaxID=1618387 RepID=A0A0G1KVU8_9BACT|nr:MAG: hypothetical protein UW44_C0005G0091 [Candidatus Collierbacteria bacterium GW2011_GWB2_44_22]KKT68054.1 MAG: hypothetical protein UW64_C0030G0002 [Microgenomates group bacterium GW2011_GWC1_44_37]HCQ31121.1 hypothetical protein [Candidatus Collierbacteria bacterium]